MRRIRAYFIIIFLFLLSFTLPLFSSANEILSDTKTETILRGVTRTDASVHMGSYRLAYHYITADLTEPHLKLELLKSSRGVDVLETVSQLAATEPDTVAAMNADFFSRFSGGLGFSLGAEIKDGALIASPIEPDKMATALVSEDGTVDFSYLTLTRTVTAPNGQSHVIRHTNKHTTYFGDVILYTHDFNNGMTPAPGGNAIEVVVENDLVTDIRIGKESTPIPQGGYVLASDIGMNGFLGNNLQIGDKVTLNLTAAPDLSHIETAFGGGTLLLKDGTIPDFTHNAAGYQPRSAIGVDRTGTKVFLLAVDGRQSLSRGMTQTELAKLMQSIGCRNAMNLDGGGSTRLLAASNESSALRVVNSPTEDRKVINAVGIIGTAGVGAPVRLAIRAPQSVILQGDTLPVTYQAYDEYDHAVSPPDTVTFGMSGCEGEMQGASLHPTSPGQAYVSAFSGDLISDALSFTVLNSVSGISLPGNLSVAVGASVMPEITVFGDGLTAPVHTLSPFRITCDPSVLKVSDTGLTGVSRGITPVTFSYGSVSTTVLAVVGDASGAMRLPANDYRDPLIGSKDSGYVFRVGARNQRETCLADLTNAKLEALLSSANLGAFLGNAVPDPSRLTVGKLARKDEANALFLSLDIKKGGILLTDSNQWDTIDNAMHNSYAHHVFFLIDQPVSDWSDTEDYETFRKYLRKESRDRNIFVISPGERNTLQMDGTVRYFTVADSARGADTYEKITSLTALSFSLNGGDISYRWVPVYE